MTSTSVLQTTLPIAPSDAAYARRPPGGGRESAAYNPPIRPRRRRSGAMPVISTAGLFVLLCLFWVLLSGYFTPFLLGAGAASALAVVWLNRRMHQRAVAAGGGFRLDGALAAYWLWLLAEILRSAWAVSRIVLDPRLPISPTVVRFRPLQRSELGLVTHANSITLTPGTITVDAEPGEIPRPRRSRAAGAAGGRRQRDGPARHRASRAGADVRRRGAARSSSRSRWRWSARSLGPTVFDRAQAANTVGTRRRAAARRDRLPHRAPRVPRSRDRLRRCSTSSARSPC